MTFIIYLLVVVVDTGFFVGFGVLAGFCVVVVGFRVVGLNWTSASFEDAVDGGLAHSGWKISWKFD